MQYIDPSHQVKTSLDAAISLIKKKIPGSIESFLNMIATYCSHNMITIELRQRFMKIFQNVMEG